MDVKQIDGLQVELRAVKATRDALFEDINELQEVSRRRLYMYESAVRQIDELRGQITDLLNGEST